MIKNKNLLLSIIIASSLIYLIVLVFLFFFQRSLLYHPNVNNYFNDKLKVDIEEVQIKTSDNINLLGWFHKKDLNRFKTVVYFHGNAGKLENRIHKLNHFKDIDVNFLIISWRGFSGNSGKPTEKGLYEDGKSTIDWLKNIGLSDKDIVIYGESLGTGIATHIAQNRKFAGLVLETPFTSMVDAAKDVYPYIPVGILLKDRYENEKKIKHINIPILVMHGQADQIVPFKMGKKIYEIANKPKYSYFTKYDNHMMEYDDKLVFALSSFIKSLN